MEWRRQPEKTGRRPVIEPVELLERTVAIASPSGAERQVAEFLVSQMEAFADQAFVDSAGNAVCRLGRGKLQVLFLGHIDTVAGQIPVRIEEGRLYGRGAVDAKGSFCTAIAAASRLPAGVLENLTLTLIGAVEEEVASSKGARHVLASHPKPHLLLIGEPSGWDAITIGYKGRLVAELKVDKENFHSARDDGTAAEELVAAWSRLEAWRSEVNVGSDRLFDSLQLALQRVSSSSDGLRQKAEAVVGMRLPPRLPPERAALEAEAACGGQEGLSWCFSGGLPAWLGAKDTVLTRALRRSIRRRGGRPRFKVKTGTSDMNVVAPIWRVPTVAYGPGDSALDHRPDEHLDVSEYMRAIDVLVEALSLLGEHDEPPPPQDQGAGDTGAGPVRF